MTLVKTLLIFMYLKMQELWVWIGKKLWWVAGMVGLIVLCCGVTMAALVAVGGVILGGVILAGFFLFGSPHGMWVLTGVCAGEPYAPMAVFSACLFLGSVAVAIAALLYILYEVFRQLGPQIAGCVIDNWGHAQRIVAGRKS